MASHFLKRYILLSTHRWGWIGNTLQPLVNLMLGDEYGEGQIRKRVVTFGESEWPINYFLEGGLPSAQRVLHTNSKTTT